MSDVGDDATKGDEKVDFTFGWLALKILGKSLYSNYWSAISELTANGFDANATEVYVYLDICDKQHTYIEIIDNGCGMTPEEIQTYVKVGYNKRTDPNFNNHGHPESIMGRKGIGKLAALFLSDHYNIITRPENGEETRWSMNFHENPDNEDEKPYLETLDGEVSIVCHEQWDDMKHGTVLQLKDINLVGTGEKSFNALNYRLANMFSLSSMKDKQIFLCKKESPAQPIEFENVKKRIGLGNMAFIESSPTNPKELQDELLSYQGHDIEIPYSKIHEISYKHKLELQSFPDTPVEDTENIGFSGTLRKGTYEGRKYVLNGWIGIHSTISEKYANLNDENFKRNPAYNPTEVRLYVRNKLAVENFLSVVKNTQAFINYIEGEINFDILDDDKLADIATSNRQGLDERDGRVELLKEIVSKIVMDLIGKRLNLSKKMKDEEDKILQARRGNAKRVFISEVNTEVEHIKGVSEADKQNLALVIGNKIQGDVTPKNKHILFISHANKDKIFSDFFYYLLQNRGIKEDEIFYTSAVKPPQIKDDKVFIRQIRENIINEEALILYLTYSHYRKNEFCLFEGGAGWATRSVNDYVVVAGKYGDIPECLTTGQPRQEITCVENGKIELTQRTYIRLVPVLNRIIDHINNGRQKSNEPLVRLFETPEVLDQVQLNEMGKTARDFMDIDICKYWDAYITPGVTSYLAGNP